LGATATATVTDQLPPADVSSPTPAAGRRDWIEDDRVRRLCNYAAAAFIFYFVQQWFWPAPIGVLVQGVLIGGLTALIAFGIALVYRANRVINFAQGDLGGVPASLAVLLMVSRGWPYGLAIVCGLGASMILGGAVEFLFIDRSFKAPRLILTDVTIGLATVLTGAELGLPRPFHIAPPPQHFSSPFDFSFRINPIVFRGNDVLAMITVLCVILGLAAFFRFTAFGLSVVAASQDPEAVRFLGIPLARVSLFTWGTAALLSGAAALLIQPSVGVIGPSTFGGIFIRALGAALIGGLTSMRGAFVGGLVVGVAEAEIRHATIHTTLSGLPELCLFAAVVATLLFRPQGLFGDA